MALLGSHEETPSAAKDLSLTSRETISGIAVLTGAKNQLWGRLAIGWQPARRLVTAAGPPRRRQGPIANRPQVTNLPHKISSANRRPLSFSWDFAGRRPIQPAEGVSPGFFVEQALPPASLFHSFSRSRL